MPLHADWDNPEKTIVLWRIEGRWTMLEFLDHNLKVEAMMDEVDHPVAILIDVSGTIHAPPDFRKNLKELSGIRHRNGMGDMWVVGLRGPLRIVAELYSAIYGDQGQLHLYHDLDTARESIREAQAALARHKDRSITTKDS